MDFCSWPWWLQGAVAILGGALGAQVPSWVLRRRRHRA
jgi:hypothetical protein